MKKQQFKITYTNHEVEKVDGFVDDCGLGIYKSKYSMYSVTHLASGSSVKFFTKLSTARTFLQIIGPLTDWNQDQNSVITQLNNGLREQIDNIYKELTM